MQCRKHKGIKCFICILIFVPLCYCIVSLWCNSRIIQPLIRGGNVTIYTNNALRETATDFLCQSDGTFTALSANAQFHLETSHSVKTIVVDVKELQENYWARIFYYTDSSGLSWDHISSVLIRRGKNYVFIPDNIYNSFIIDLTGAEDAKIQISDILLYQEQIAPVSFLLFAISICLLGIVCIYVYCIKKDLAKRVYENLKAKYGVRGIYKWLLTALILTTVLFVYGRIIVSGNQYVYYDIGGGDEPETYIPQFVYYINQIRNGTLTSWNFSNGLGTSSISVIGFLLNPFLLIVFVVCCIFGVGCLNQMLLVAQIANILVCGLVCYRYLEYFEGTYFSKTIASYLYAFNGFNILFAQHYVVSDFCFYSIMTFIVLEKLIRSKHIGKEHFVFCIWCTLLFCRSLYMGYMIALFSVFYTFVRLFYDYSLSEMSTIFIKIGQIGVFACLGVAIAGPFLLPVASDYLFSSTRILGGGQSLTAKMADFLLIPYPLDTIKTNLLRLFSNNLEGSGNSFFGLAGGSANDYYSPPTLYFSIFILCFVFIYYVSLYKTILDKRKRIVAILAGGLCVFVVINRLGSAAFNAFVEPFGRYSYLLMPVFAYVSAYSLDQLRKCQKSTIYILFVVNMLMLMILLRQYVASNSKHIVASQEFIGQEIIIVVLISAVMLFQKRRYVLPDLARGLAVFLVINVMLESYETVNERAFCSFSRDLINEDDFYTEDALDYIEKEDPDLYRIEKNYYDLIYFNDALFQNYRGMSTYNSVLNGNVKEFYRLYCGTAVNYYYYDSFWYSFLNVSNDILPNTLMGIRYILSDGTQYPVNMYDLVYSNDEIDVYRNKASKAFGIFYEYATPKSDIISLSVLERQKALSKAVVLEDADVESEDTVVTYDEIARMNRSATYLDLQQLPEQIVPEDSQISMDKDILTISSGDKARFTVELGSVMHLQKGDNCYIEFLTNMGYDDSFQVFFDDGSGNSIYMPYYYRGNIANEWQGARILLPADTQCIHFECSDSTVAFKSLKIVGSGDAVVPENTIPQIAARRSNYIEGTVNTDRPGYLFMPIPFERGWSAKVDGKAAQIYQADSGFSVLKLGEGLHQFAFEYEYPYFREGLCISGICAAITLILFFWNLRMQKRTGKDRGRNDQL